MLNKLDENPDFSEFEKSTFSDWKAALSKELKGKAPESVDWTNELGFSISPYSRPDHSTTRKEFESGMWDVHLRFGTTDIKELNKRILWSLNQGVNSIELNLSEIQISELTHALNGVFISYISVQFTSVTNWNELATWLRNKASSENAIVADLRGVIQSDTFEASFFEEFHGFSYGVSNSVSAHNKGANAVQELVWNLSLCHDFIVRNSVVKRIQVVFGIGNEFYLEIAKLRVFQKLWKKIADSYSWKGEVILMAETSEYLQTAIDENNNLLRATSQAVSAIAGGVNSLHILPADAWTGEWNQNSQRIAINIHHLLSDESHLNEYRNAASGSWYLGDLEQKIADLAWRSFVKWEKLGGVSENSSAFMSEVQATDMERKSRVMKGERTIIGVNRYPGSMSEKINNGAVDRLSAELEKVTGEGTK